MAWEVAKNDNICPSCNRVVEVYVVVRDGIEYVEAERCKRCRWKADFSGGDVSISEL